MNACTNGQRHVVKLVKYFDVIFGKVKIERFLIIFKYCGENGCDFMLSFFHTLGVKTEALLVFGTLLGMSGE